MTPPGQSSHERRGWSASNLLLIFSLTCSGGVFAQSSPPPCSQWNVSGAWSLSQANIGSVALNIQQEGTALSGTADQGAGPVSITGNMSGSAFNFTAPWNSYSEGYYTATMNSAGQAINGFTDDLLCPTCVGASWATTSNFSCSSVIYGADTYDGRSLTIPSITIGNATYTEMVVTVDQIISGPSGAAPNGSGDFYNPANNQLTVPKVIYGAYTYYNVVVTVAKLNSIGDVNGADFFDGADVYIPSVQVQGGQVYTNVAITPGTLIGVAGGMPMAVQDQYNFATQQLQIPAVEYGGHVYTNVTITVGSLVTVGGSS
jgi:hypothetical protein